MLCVCLALWLPKRGTLMLLLILLIVHLWDGSPAAGRSIRWMWVGGVETRRGGLRAETTLSGVSTEDSLRVPPRNQQDGLEGS